MHLNRSKSLCDEQSSDSGIYISYDDTASKKNKSRQEREREKEHINELGIKLTSMHRDDNPNRSTSAFPVSRFIPGSSVLPVLPVLPVHCGKSWNTPCAFSGPGWLPEDQPPRHLPSRLYRWRLFDSSPANGIAIIRSIIQPQWSSRSLMPASAVSLILQLEPLYGA